MTVRPLQGRMIECILPRDSLALIPRLSMIRPPFEGRSGFASATPPPRLGSRGFASAASPPRLRLRNTAPAARLPRLRPAARLPRLRPAARLPRLRSRGFAPAARPPRLGSRGSAPAAPLTDTQCAPRPVGKHRPVRPVCPGFARAPSLRRLHSDESDDSVCICTLTGTQWGRERGRLLLRAYILNSPSLCEPGCPLSSGRRRGWWMRRDSNPQPFGSRS